MKKQQLRKELKSLRNQLSRDQVDRWSKKICANIMLSPQYRHADVIFGYLAVSYTHLTLPTNSLV